MPGVMTVVQAFGNRLNYHPHIYVLLTEGGKAHSQANHSRDNGKALSLRF
jgi:hypothetical protein